MEVFNLAMGELGRDHGDTDGWRARSQRIGDRLGAAAIGGTVYEVEDGQRLWPYHYHHGVEDWLLVVVGAPVLRQPDGEQVLRPGDVVCFPSGEAGAHALWGPGRFLLLSVAQPNSVCVYPDSDKVGTRPAGGDDRLDFRRADAVGYWDGER
jgi:uncharacterized cupin superfamily protein